MEMTFVDRRNSGCLKWDGMREPFGEDNLLPLWVADMDFRAPECVLDALRKQVDHGVFGYSLTPPGFFEAFCQWQSRRHGYSPRRDTLRFAPGVMTACSWLVRLLTQPGEQVVALTPLYDHLLKTPAHQGRELILSHLLCDNGIYTVDFADLEQKLSKPEVKLFLLCSPHNPVGRVWTAAELRTMLDLCRRHGVKVIADEIHQDFIHQRTFIPAAAAGDYDDMLVSLAAPSKTFNLAGLKTAVVSIPDEILRRSYDTMAESLVLNEGNVMGCTAAQAAWIGGEPWFEELLQIIRGNYALLTDTVCGAHPKVIVSPLEGTYLAWLDFSAYLADSQLADYFQGRCRLGLGYGRNYGPGGEGHVRVNLATSREVMERAAEAIASQLLA